MRFGVPHAGAPAMPGGLGMLGIAVQAAAQTVVLLVDLQRANKGASVTNAVEACLAYVSSRLATEWGAEAVRDVAWLELDSLGWFDRVHVRSPVATAQDLRAEPVVCWEPLRGADAAPRTLKAFMATYPQHASAAMAEIQTYVDEHRLTLRVRQEHDVDDDRS